MDWWLIACLAVVTVACVLALFWVLWFIASVQNLIDGMKEREN